MSRRRTMNDLHKRCVRMVNSHRRRAAKHGAVLDYNAAGLLRRLHETVTFGETRCRYCRVVLFPDTWIADHATPTGAGGAHSIHNLHLDVCLDCNEGKGIFTAGQVAQLRALARSWAAPDPRGIHAALYLWDVLRRGLRQRIVYHRGRKRS